MRNFYALVSTTFITLSAKAWEIPFDPTASSHQTPDTYDVVRTMHWGVKVAVMIVTFFLCMRCSKSLSDNEYTLALRLFAASILAGISPYLAEAFVI